MDPDRNELEKRVVHALRQRNRLVLAAQPLDWPPTSVMEPLKVVGLALAKARFDLHYYGKKKPDSNPLRFEIEKQQHKIDKLVNERNNIGGQIRRLDVPEKRAEYFNVANAIFYARGMIRVSQRELIRRATRKDFESIDDLMNWWNESYATVHDIHLAYSLSRWCEELYKDSSRTRPQNRHEMAEMRETLTRDMEGLTQELQNVRMELSGTVDSRSPSALKRRYLRCLSRYIVVQAEIEGLEQDVHTRREDEFKSIEGLLEQWSESNKSIHDEKFYDSLVGLCEKLAGKQMQLSRILTLEERAQQKTEVVASIQDLTKEFDELEGKLVNSNASKSAYLRCLANHLTAQAQLHELVRLDQNEGLHTPQQRRASDPQPVVVVKPGPHLGF